jgi:hypothetical protein
MPPVIQVSLRFEVFAADYEERPFSGMLRRVELVRTAVSEEPNLVILRSVRRLLVTAGVVPSSPIWYFFAACVGC